MLALIRAALAAGWLAICATFGTIYALVRFRHVNTLHPVAQVFSWGCRKFLGLRVEYRGYERLLKDGPYILLANHQHNLDVVLLAGVYPPNTITIGKREVMYIPFFNLIFYATGNLLIDRKNLERAKITLANAAASIRKTGARIWLFPEGTRRYGLGLGPFKKGPFHLAVEAQVPLQPVVASSYAGAVDLNRWNAGRVIIEVLPPIPVAGRDIDDLIQEAFEKMKAAIDRLDREVRG
ncbi:MAG TPA: 1-acylglycerol-3-phosphate O-acyltransferase [Bdellovibrionales bacterium]|nr:1-acylglycerol-3-phosphate O-acyltransferase [Bdellovibrionales bacterium]